MTIKINGMTSKNTTENDSSAVIDLKEMSRRYYFEAEKLASYREQLMERRRQHPSCEELHSLDVRIDALYGEINDLRATALHLKRLAAQKPLTPSLSARGKRYS